MPEDTEEPRAEQDTEEEPEPERKDVVIEAPTARGGVS